MNMLVTYRITKRLHGALEGIEVTDTLTQDATLPAPFKPGELVRGIGSDYTVVACEPGKPQPAPKPGETEGQRTERLIQEALQADRAVSGAGMTEGQIRKATGLPASRVRNFTLSMLLEGKIQRRNGLFHFGEGTRLV